MKKILKVIEELEKNRHQMCLSKESIDFILIIFRTLKTKNILEIGTFNGYSALNFSLIVEKVITIEIDKKAAEMAENNFKKAEAENIKIIRGNALEILKNLNQKFDAIFIDAKKSEYKEYLKLSLNLLTEKGLIFADNTGSHKESMKDFFEFLKDSNLFHKEFTIGKGLTIISNNFNSRN